MNGTTCMRLDIKEHLPLSEPGGLTDEKQLATDQVSWLYSPDVVATYRCQRSSPPDPCLCLVCLHLPETQPIIQLITANISRRPEVVSTSTIAAGVPKPGCLAGSRHSRHHQRGSTRKYSAIGVVTALLCKLRTTSSADWSQAPGKPCWATFRNQ